MWRSHAIPILRAVSYRGIGGLQKNGTAWKMDKSKFVGMTVPLIYSGGFRFSSPERIYAARSGWQERTFGEIIHLDMCRQFGKSFSYVVLWIGQINNIGFT